MALSPWRGKTPRKCEWCSKQYRPSKKSSRFCSRLCGNRWASKTRKTTKGRYVSTKGYVLIYMPTHPSASKSGYVMEHRLVMEQHIGRRLRKSEVVHHIDGQRSRNAIENLVVMTKRRHDKQTSLGIRRMTACPQCGHEFSLRGRVRSVGRRS